MINSHKELVDELSVFVSKMPLINTFYYIKDVDTLSEEIDKREPRVFVVGLDGISFDDEGYNAVLTYKFVIADETIYNDESIVNSEVENIFCVSALSDFLRYVNETPIEFNGLSTSTESTAEKTFTTISGNFDFVVKRSPSYWANLDV